MGFKIVTKQNIEIDNIIYPSRVTCICASRDEKYDKLFDEYKGNLYCKGGY